MNVNLNAAFAILVLLYPASCQAADGDCGTVRQCAQRAVEVAVRSEAAVKVLEGRVDKLAVNFQRAYAVEVSQLELEGVSGQSGCVRENPTHVMGCARRWCINQQKWPNLKFIGGALQEINGTTGVITIVCLRGDS